jgi:ketosteroid isomerase-like protein
MTSNATRAATLASALEAGVRNDRDALEALYVDDVVAWTPAFFAESAKELLAALDDRDDAFSDIAVDIRPLDVGGDHACAEWQVTMTHTGPLVVAGGAVVEPTGLRITLHGATVAEFRGERICALRQYWDELTVFEQLGLLHDGEG